ncbi:hypothetical protein Cni_G02658 [Canna indica]|uniref:Uncharacterized protein n=1 Tax=Canna indica TaxID=4628 RepID=A0AAQ3JQE3_9LILI|nr:hypothetical protein Cni_G02658 [Canna indica]
MFIGWWLAREEEPDEGWVIKCNDARLRVVESQAPITLDKWLASATDEEEMEMTYCEPMGIDPSIWSPYYVQLTEFGDKAVVIGMTCSHMHADPTCAFLLVCAWSDAHRRAYIMYPPFLHPPALLPRANARTCSPFFSSEFVVVASDPKKGRMANLPPSSSPTPMSSQASLTPASPLPLPHPRRPLLDPHRSRHRDEAWCFTQLHRHHARHRTTSTAPAQTSTWA